MTIQQSLLSHAHSGVRSDTIKEHLIDAAERINYLEERTDELEDALAAARQQLVLLGGDRIPHDQKIYGDAIHEAVLMVVDQALGR